MWDANNALEETQASLKLTENSLMAAITREMEGGKPKFSNDTLRAAELWARQSANPAWVNQANDLKQQRADLAQAKIELEYVTNQFSSARHLAGLYEGWMKTQML